MTDRALCCYDYVNHPYAVVRDALRDDPERVFRQATAAALADAAVLHVRLGAIDLGADIAIQLDGVEHDDAYGRPTTRLALTWHAAHHPRLFPTMTATLTLFALSPTETQLELRGSYTPPMGKLGEVLDAAVGHRLAEAAVKRFLGEVAVWLRAAPIDRASPVAADLQV